MPCCPGPKGTAREGDTEGQPEREGQTSGAPESLRTSAVASAVGSPPVASVPLAPRPLPRPCLTCHANESAREKREREKLQQREEYTEVCVSACVGGGEECVYRR